MTTITEIVDFIKSKEGQPFLNIMTFVIGGIFGFLISRFTLSRSDKVAFEQKIYENSISHTRELEKRYQDFVVALSSYSAKTSKVNLDDFREISTAGDMYFSELKIICDAILSNKIDKGTRDRTFVPKVMEALQKNVHQYYETLQAISEKVGGGYSGEFRRENYQSLIQVAEKYAPATPWQTAANIQPTRG